MQKIGFCDPFSVKTMEKRTCHRCGKDMERKLAYGRMQGVYSCDKCNVTETVTISPKPLGDLPECFQCRARDGESIKMTEQPNRRGAWAGRMVQCPQCNFQMFQSRMQPLEAEVILPDDPPAVDSLRSDEVLVSPRLAVMGVDEL